MNESSLIFSIVVSIIPVLLAITLHEAAHGYVAHRLGDDTAKNHGRLSLNPFKHLDPIGTFLVPALCLYLGGFIFGWAKPVPVNASRLRRPKRDMAWVALAGPLSNFLMVIGWGLIAKMGLMAMKAGYDLALFFVYNAKIGISINSVLMLLNLLPIPPLDGSRLVMSILPNRILHYYMAIEPYGFVILLLLMTANVLEDVMATPLVAFISTIYDLFQL